jgi:cell volume regulation protein A
MHDVEPFGVVVLIAAAALALAVLSSHVTRWIGVPTPAIFLVVAAVASDLYHPLGHLSVVTNQRIVTVALAVILFDGGMHIGVRRMRRALTGVAWLGTAGTFVTAAAMALLAHYLFDFAWRPALALGTALAPTDPAVVFSVLGKREIEGRSGTLLEGESGANDPVGIALMIAVLGASGGSAGAVFGGIGQFALQMAVGLAFGFVGGRLVIPALGRVRLPSASLYPVYMLAMAVLIYGAAAACHGSGFLAVFVAGILVGDEQLPSHRSVRGFTAALAALGEIVAFVVLGLSVSLSHVFSGGRVWTGVALAALLILAVRPVLVGMVLWPIGLSRGERGFVLWAGLKGAVPILLGTYVLAEHVASAARVYDVIFVVVWISVVVQGGLVPAVARRFRVPMRDLPH